MEEQIKILQQQRMNSEGGISVSSTGEYDSSMYGELSKNNYSNVLYDVDRDSEDQMDNELGKFKELSGLQGDIQDSGSSSGTIDNITPFTDSDSGLMSTRISERETEVHM